MVDILHKSKEIETAIKTKKMYVSTPFNRLQSIENKLNKILKKNLIRKAQF